MCPIRDAVASALAKANGQDLSTAVSNTASSSIKVDTRRDREAATTAVREATELQEEVQPISLDHGRNLRGMP